MNVIDYDIGSKKNSRVSLEICMNVTEVGNVLDKGGDIEEQVL